MNYGVQDRVGDFGNHSAPKRLCLFRGFATLFLVC